MWLAISQQQYSKRAYWCHTHNVVFRWYSGDLEDAEALRRGNKKAGHCPLTGLLPLVRLYVVARGLPSIVLWLHHAQISALCYSLCPIVHIQLAIDVASVYLDSAQGKIESLGDLAV